MRVLLVTPSYFPIIGGSEVLTQIYAIKLNETGIDTDIMTYNMSKKWYPKWRGETVRDGATKVIKIAGVNPLPGLPNPLANLVGINVLPNPISAKGFRDYDIIHFISEADLSLPLLSCSVKKPKLLSCLAIYRYGGIFSYYTYKRPYLLKLFRTFFSRVAELYLVPSHAEEELLSGLGVPKTKISILPLGVDIATFRPNTEMKVENLILFVGRIDRIKGLDILLRALPFVKTTVQLAIIGSKWDETYVKELEEMSEAINESGKHHVMFLGAMDQKELVQWYQRASVLVCPYLHEPHSNVTREALACSTPVISTGSHMSDQHPDGILLTQRDPEKLAGAIESLLRDRGLRERAGRDGRTFVEQNLSWDSIMKTLKNLYESMLRH